MSEWSNSDNHNSKSNKSYELGGWGHEINDGDWTTSLSSMASPTSVLGASKNLGAHGSSVGDTTVATTTTDGYSIYSCPGGIYNIPPPPPSPPEVWAVGFQDLGLVQANSDSNIASYIYTNDPTMDVAIFGPAFVPPAPHAHAHHVLPHGKHTTQQQQQHRMKLQEEQMLVRLRQAGMGFDAISDEIHSKLGVRISSNALVKRYQKAVDAFLLVSDFMSRLFDHSPEKKPIMTSRANIGTYQHGS